MARTLVLILLSWPASGLGFFVATLLYSTMRRVRRNSDDLDMIEDLKKLDTRDREFYAPAFGNWWRSVSMLVMLIVCVIAGPVSWSFPHREGESDA